MFLTFEFLQFYYQKALLFGGDTSFPPVITLFHGNQTVWLTSPGYLLQIIYWQFLLLYSYFSFMVLPSSLRSFTMTNTILTIKVVLHVGCTVNCFKARLTLYVFTRSESLLQIRWVCTKIAVVQPIIKLHFNITF